MTNTRDLQDAAVAYRFASEYFWASSRDERDAWRESPNERNPYNALTEAQDSLIECAKELERS